MKAGIVLRGHDELIEGRAKAAGLPVVISADYDLPFEKTLFVEVGTRVPWDLLPAAWHFLERWDAAVPFWKYGTLAQDLGTAEEREIAKGVVRDLRVMAHSVELLFVRNSEQGRALVDGWRDWKLEIGDERLAFLCAVYEVKPRLCVLPVTWLAEVREASKQTFWRPVRSMNAGKPLVRVEVAPGRFVKCHEGDEQRVREQFAQQLEGRR